MNTWDEQEARRVANVSDRFIDSVVDHYSTELDWAIHFLKVHIDAEKPVYSDKTLLSALMLLRRFADFAIMTHWGACHIAWLQYMDNPQEREEAERSLYSSLLNAQRGINETLGPAYREFIGGLLGVDHRVLDQMRPQREPPPEE